MERIPNGRYAKILEGRGKQISLDKPLSPLRRAKLHKQVRETGEPFEGQVEQLSSADPRAGLVVLREKKNDGTGRLEGYAGAASFTIPKNKKSADHAGAVGLMALVGAGIMAVGKNPQITRRNLLIGTSGAVMTMALSACGSGGGGDDGGGEAEIVDSQLNVSILQQFPESSNNSTVTAKVQTEPNKNWQILDGTTIIANGTSGANGLVDIELTLDDSTYTNLKIRVTDPVANKTAEESFDSCKIDTQAPQATIMTDLPSKSQTSQVNVVLMAPSDAIGCQIVDGDNVVANVSEIGAQTLVSLNLADGVYNLRVKTWDALGNTSLVNLNPCEVKTTTPIVTITTDLPASANLETGNEFTIKFTVSPDTKSWRVLNGASNLTPPVTGTNIGEITATFTLADGVYNDLRIVTEDNVEHEVVTPLNALVVDTGAPNAAVVAQFTALTKESTNTASANIAGDVTNWEIVNGSNVLTTGTATGNNVQITLTELASGTYNNVKLRVWDAAGNPREVAFDGFVIDAEAPTNPTLAIAGGAVAVNTRNVTLTLAADGSPAEMMVKEGDPNFTGTDWEPFNGTTEFVLSEGDGEKTVHAKYRDAAGNVSGATSDTIKFDTVAPTIGDWVGTVPTAKNTQYDGLVMSFNEDIGTIVFVGANNGSVVTNPEIINGNQVRFNLLTPNASGFSIGFTVKDPAGNQVITSKAEFLN